MCNYININIIIWFIFFLFFISKFLIFYFYRLVLRKHLLIHSLIRWLIILFRLYLVIKLIFQSNYFTIHFIFIFGCLIFFIRSVGFLHSLYILNFSIILIIFRFFISNLSLLFFFFKFFLLLEIHNLLKDNFCFLSSCIKSFCYLKYLF